MRLAELVLDFDLYPRAEVDSQHVHYLCDALEAGADLPPIIADKESKRVIDGFHRYRAHKRIFGEDATVAVVLKAYGSEAEMFLDAMRYNAGHGRSLTTFDRAHSVLRAEAFGISPEQVASALSITAEAVGRLRAERVGTLKVAGATAKTIPLKRTIRHMAGRELTAPQAEANAKLSGMEQLFYVNQLIMLIENDLLDTSNDRLMDALAKLTGLLTKEQRRAA